ncbi:TPA: hypothetical protein ACF2PS_002090 [Legionella pneumophila]
MKKKRSPEVVTISTESLEQLKSRIDSGVLLEGDKKIVLAILGTYSWLHHQLQSSKFTLGRLKKMFGFVTEKRLKTGLTSATPPDFSKEGTSADQALSLDGLQGVGQSTPEKK